MQPLRRILRPGLRLLRVLAHKPYATGYDKGKSDAVKQQYLIEVSIPWTTLGQTNITPGAALGLDVHINENEDDEMFRSIKVSPQSQLGWCQIERERPRLILIFTEHDLMAIAVRT